MDKMNTINNVLRKVLTCTLLNVVHLHNVFG